MLFNEEHFENSLRRLSRADKKLAKIIKVVRPVAPKPRIFDFSSLVRVIISQQLSNAAATTIYSRLEAQCNGSITPINIAMLSDAKIQSLGISASKTHFIREAYNFSIANPNIFKSIKNETVEDAKIILTKIKGIGEWSASIILMFYIGNDDIFPSGDTTLKNAIKKLYFETDCFIVTDRWKPYRSVASLTLWRWTDIGSPQI